jgi:hypothetical protein
MARIIIPEGLVGYYSLDGNTIDSSGSGNHGTLVNSVGYRQGKFKHGVGFNGSSTYVDIGSRLGTMAPPVTLAAWVYFSSAPSWGSSVFPRVISTLGQSGANWHGYELLIYNSVSVANVTAAYGVLYQAGQGTSAVYTRGSVEGITRPGWYHLAVTATAGTPTVPDIYINGVVNQNQNNFAVGGNKTTVAGLWNARIGGISNYAGADYFARDTMVIDDARIYNRVLSPGEILTLASQRPPPRRVWVPGADVAPAATSGVYIQAPKRTRQPQGYGAIRPYWRSRGLVFLFNGATFQDLVTGKFATNSGGVVRRANANGNLGPDISGSQYLEFPDSNALDITTALSIFWRGAFDATVGNYRSVISKADTNGASNTPFEIYLASVDGKLTTFRASGSGYRGYQSDASDPFGGQTTSTMGLIYGDGLIQTAPVLYANRTQLSVTSGNTDTGNCIGNSKTLRLGRRQDAATQLDGSIEIVALFNQALTTSEYLGLYDDPWGQLLVPSRRVIYFGAGGAGGGNITFTADPYSLAFTGSAASLFAGRKLASNPASLTLSGAVATPKAARKLTATPSSLTLSGATATPKAARKLTATPATLTFTGSNATFLSGKILSASPGTLVFTGSTANLNKSSKLVASPGSLTLSGSTANMFRGKILLADPASFALTGSSAGFVRTRVLPADPGTMQFTGASATLGAPVVVQKARPGSDISAGGWLPSTGSDLYAMLDETSYNDSDYIYSPDNPTTETAEIKFTSITDPGVHTGHTLRFRLAAVGQDTVFDVYLMCGATQIATWQKTVVAGDTTTYTETLTTGEAGNITDYTDLRIKVVAHA